MSSPASCRLDERARSHHPRLPAQHRRERGDAARSPAARTISSSSTAARSPTRRCARPARRSARPSARGPTRGSSSPAARRRSSRRRSRRCRKWRGCSAIARSSTSSSLPRAGRAERPRLRHHGGARDGAASGRRLRRAGARLRRGAERLRPSLHLLHHPLRPREQPLGAGRAGGRPDQGAGRRGLPRGGADRRRRHQLRPRPARRADARAS